MSLGPTPLRRPMPAGYLLLGVALLFLSFGFTIAVADADGGVLVRAGFGIVALASALLVEALWYVRPWVARAADAWAAACCGAVLLPGLAAAIVDGVSAGIVVGTAVMLCFVAVPCGAVRWYVRDRARRLGLAPGLVP